MGVLSTEAPPIDEPARRPVERIKKTLRKYTSKLQLRRPSAKSDEPTWDSIAPAEDASDPPRYSRLRMLDDYRWPVCEPLEILVLSNDQAAPSTMPPGSFRCQMITIPTRAASSSCPDDKETSLDRLITLPCGHVYHPACLQGELRRHAYARCPRCQHTLHYRLCHHRVHIPYFAPGTAIHPDELDGACRCCAPFPFMQHVMSERGEGARSGDRTHLVDNN
ncbi:hypothetical protein G7054_g6543 [Neopestalotiopsis clavispora]|nr:hypothetical protein G7054_g6543 [Neopestalotiopsis clavispora]